MNRRCCCQTFFLLTAFCLALLSGRAEATLLNPLDFASLGANPFTLAGAYTIDTSGATPVLTRPDSSTVNGIVHIDGTQPIAVFTFDDITIGAGTTITGLQNGGSRPLALLSHDFFTMTGGTLDASGANGANVGGAVNGGNGGNAGPGGGGGGGGGTLGFTPGSGGLGFVNGANGVDVVGGNGGSVVAGGGGTSGPDFTDGGGGAGGGIFVHAPTVSLNGNLNAIGGRAAPRSGAGAGADGCSS